MRLEILESTQTHTFLPNTQSHNSLFPEVNRQILSCKLVKKSLQNEVEKSRYKIVKEIRF